MPTTPDALRPLDDVWAAAAAERAALADDLAILADAQWAHPTLCKAWRVEEVVAHLTAAASIGPLRWMASVIGARFDFDLHNARRVAERLGATPAQTLDGFRRIIHSTTSTFGPPEAWLGEVVVHAYDIRRPLGIVGATPIATATQVATFYASRNFAVASKDMITGVRVEATDGPFAHGSGPLVTATTLALIMVMAGRSAYGDDLDGPGAALLRARLADIDAS